MGDARPPKQPLDLPVLRWEARWVCRTHGSPGGLWSYKFGGRGDAGCVGCTAPVAAPGLTNLAAVRGAGRAERTASPGGLWTCKFGGGVALNLWGARPS